MKKLKINIVRIDPNSKRWKKTLYCGLKRTREDASSELSVSVTGNAQTEVLYKLGTPNYD